MADRGVKMMARRSTGKVRVARSLWYIRKGAAELRSVRLQPPAPGEALVRTLYSGISRGTERLVFEGAIGETEFERMRCPMQEGSFPFPVKYGYCATGVVEDGPAALAGRNVFVLHPHQDFFVAPVAMLAPIPDQVPVRRATLAANMETTLNALWDSGAGPGDKIVVVGCGIVGLLVASLAARLPGATVTAVDTDTSRRPLVASLGAAFATPDRTPGDADIVFHTSATGAGLNTAIKCAGIEGTIVEMSWYGAKPVQVELGGAFHSRRLKLVSSQVGMVSPGRRARWDYRRRLTAALSLLDLPALDALVAEEIAFEDAPKRLPQVLAASAQGLAPVIRYPNS
jgi:2-desacetyl-2-hydroxyethyl bacteriochlorophyllide A dehydrogenase